MKINVPEQVLYICQRLKGAGYDAWLVGGAVRDSLMGREAHDWDIATNALPTVVVKMFPKVIETGIQYGTVTVLINNVGYEVTTFRGDGTYNDGRRPTDVKFLDSIYEDLARRDFTMNSVAYNPLTDEFFDPFNGIADIQAKTIKAVGEAAIRFSEDGLRIMRAFRFAATLDFNIEAETLNGIWSSIKNIRNVSPERVRDELLKIMMADKPSKSLRIMADNYEVIAEILPEFLPMFFCTQNKYHEFDAWEHTLVTLDACPNKPLFRMAALLHDIGKPAVRRIKKNDVTFYDHEVIGAELANKFLDRLKFSVMEGRYIVHLVRHHFIMYSSDWTDAAIRRWIVKVGKENIEDLFDLAFADIVGKGAAKTDVDSSLINELKKRIEEISKDKVSVFTIKSLAINGKDVMNHLNIGAGPTIGKILNRLFEAVLNNPECNTKEQLLKMASVFLNE